MTRRLSAHWVSVVVLLAACSNERSRPPATTVVVTPSQAVLGAGADLAFATPTATVAGEVPATVLFAPTGTIDIERAIVRELNAAKTSVRVAQYVLTSPTLARALANAQARGVPVRVLVDGGIAGSVSLSMDDWLAARGVPVKRMWTASSATSKKFHHKFCVIDDVSLIVGSFNWTETADMYNYENIVLVRDLAISRAYVREFDSLWAGGAGGGATTSTVAFAPSGWAQACQDHVSDAIGSAQTEIVAAIYLFTSDRIEYAFTNALRRGVRVSILYDNRESWLYRDTLIRLQQNGARLKAVRLPGTGAFAAKFHHKFAVIDGARVVTGSFNWAPQQDRIGWDSVLTLSNRTLARTYIAEFNRVWNSSIAN